MDALAIRPNLRLVYAALTALLVAAVVLETGKHGFHWQLPAFAAGPDIALLLGAGRRLERGRLHPRAVSLYNAVHRFWGPVALAIAAVALDLSVGWFIAAVAWAIHVALDRTVGYGLRTTDGFQRA
jgi:hypothetical protein